MSNCAKLVDKHMQSVGAQKIVLPSLTSSHLWEKSGRLKDCCGELLITKDHQGKEHVLGPTHEEAITSLVAQSSPISYKQLPLKLYQIGLKFRDELKPRFGLIRTKEFLMKDLYSFDVGLDEAKVTYDEIDSAYKALFTELGIPWKKVRASTGMMGGHLSNEYHIPSHIGEDTIIFCEKCDFASNCEEYDDLKQCPVCVNSDLRKEKSIEIAHTFLLGHKYSKALGATFLQSNGKPKNIFMGCYGIGISRLIGATLEALSTENALRWPLALAPYKICVIPAKSGSKEEAKSDVWVEKLCAELCRMFDSDQILLDDRNNLTIGKRLMENKRMGYPVIIVAGSKILESDAKFEMHLQLENSSQELIFTDLINEIGKYFHSKQTEEEFHEKV
ncbi:probable proline--tRNA ligase, mitochondrial isoform X2 [Hermetia illucens]|nr:probable proline--tRNA ligase, mitochondrial isoform X2 [Hermetia illucens]